MNEPASTRSWIVAIVLLAIAVLVGAIALWSTRPQPVEITVLPPAPSATPSATETLAPITVYVTGAVLRPDQLVQLAPGSRVEDAIAAAGGAAANADLSAVNRAARVRDGDQVHVPEVGETTVLATPGVSVVFINSATSAELEALPGVGPELAAAILTRREQAGPFTSLDDLDTVEGIGPRMLETLAPLVSFETEG